MYTASPLFFSDREKMEINLADPLTCQTLKNRAQWGPPTNEFQDHYYCLNHGNTDGLKLAGAQSTQYNENLHFVRHKSGLARLSKAHTQLFVQHLIYTRTLALERGLFDC